MTVLVHHLQFHLKLTIIRIISESDRSLDIEIDRIEKSEIEWSGDGVQRVEKSNGAPVVTSLRC